MFALCAASALVCQVQVGPLDAFKANYGGSIVSVKYHYTYGIASPEALDRLRSWRRGTVPLEGGPSVTSDVLWECDGSAQHLIYAPTPPLVPGGERSVAFGAANLRGKMISRGSSSVETLSDGSVRAEHHLGESDVQVYTTNEPGMNLECHAPFCWWGSFQFPTSLGIHFKSEPSVRDVTVNGINLILSTYQIEYSEGNWYRLEVYYDPALNFLPRYVRSLGEAEGRSTCKEMLVLDARPCASGGLIPSDVYEIEFATAPPGHLPQDRTYDRLDLQPTKVLLVGHLEMQEMIDRKEPLRLAKLEGAKFLVAQSGHTPLVSSSALTLPRIRALLGRKLTDPKPVRALHVDQAEIDERFDRMNWLGPVSACLATLVVVVGVLAYRRSRSEALILIVLASLACSTGCDRSGRPKAEDRPVELSAAFERGHLLFDDRQDVLHMELQTRNSGGTPIRIFKVDGGCSCREIDDARFPADLGPGSVMNIPVSMKTYSFSQDVNRFAFKFETDRGTVAVPISLVAMARHSVTPRTLGCPILGEKDRWDFELRQRSCREKPARPTNLTLEVPPEFDITGSREEEGTIDAPGGWSYRDVVYSLTLRHEAKGLFKSAILLKDGDGKGKIEVPVTWQRQDFMNAVPSRVFLGAHPIRVFLSCPDASVELTRVLASPDGVKAIVTSPREVTIALADDAPAVIDGTVEVATNAPARPAIRIPTRRFSVGSPAGKR